MQQQDAPKYELRSVRDSLMQMASSAVMEAANSLIKYKHAPSAKFKNCMSSTMVRKAACQQVLAEACR